MTSVSSGSQPMAMPPPSAMLVSSMRARVEAARSAEKTSRSTFWSTTASPNVASSGGSSPLSSVAVRACTRCNT